MSIQDYLLCPECGKHYSSGSGMYCPDDGKPLVPMGQASFDNPVGKKLTSLQEKIEQRFMLSGIDYFTEGQRLFHLVYVLLCIQIIFMLFLLLGSCFLLFSGVTSLVALLNSILRAINNFRP